nr:DNA adenine methylase [Komagataeibacter sp. FNDCF1]
MERLYLGTEHLWGMGTMGMSAATVAFLHGWTLPGELRWQVTSRDEFERLKAAEACSLTDLERAVRFLYLQRLAFGGKVNGRNFGVSLRPARFDVHTLEPVLADIHARLGHVTIECLPFADVPRRYDRVDALFYLDPPYWNCEDDYGAPFRREDLHVLLDDLTRLQDRFIMSLNDTPEVRQMFGGFDIEAIGLSCSLSREAHARGPRGEVLISNQPMRGALVVS